MFMMTAMQIVLLFWDFFSGMQITLTALLAYVILVYEQSTNIFFTFYLYTLIKFMINAQVALINRTKKINNQDLNGDVSQTIEEIAFIRQELVSIQKDVSSMLSLQIFLITFDFVQSIVAQVKKNYFLM